MKKIFFLLCLICFAFPVRASESLKIGFLGPMTGPFAEIGRESRQILMLMALDINERGGLPGKKIELIFEDENDAPAAAKRLVEQGVTAVLGPFTSDHAQSVQGIFNENKILHISYGATAVTLTERGLPYFFRTCPRDDEQAKVFVRMLGKTKIRKVALLHDDSLYGKGLAQSIENQLDARMMDPIYIGSITPGQSDYSETLKNIRATSPELIFYAGYYPEAARLLLSRHQLQWEIPLVGGDAVNHAGLIEMAGPKAVRNLYILTLPNPAHINLPHTQRFVQQFQKVYGYVPTSPYPLLAGDAFAAVTESMTNIRATDVVRISDYLRRRYFKKSGLTGEIYFNDKGDVVNDLYTIYQVDDKGHFFPKGNLQF